MNVSYKWLKRYLNTNVGAEKIAEMLTQIGLEVDSIHKTESIKGGLRGLVVGEVLTCEAHPNSDHLHVTTVNVGEAEPLGIVCGAPNVAAGQKVIVATCGTVLYDGDKEFVIKPSKLRGVASNGMICAEDEIGVGISHDGIIVLPADIPVGTKASDYYKVEEDWLIEVDITPNRVDAASIYGVARDLACALRVQGEKVELSRPDVDDFKVDNNSLPVKIVVENTEACPRYSGLTIKGVKVASSPAWLQDALRSIGLTPINNIVDVTNYILFAVGQPLHAFDMSEVKGGEIHVKTGLEGVKFVTLDEKEHTLTADDLMICNSSEPMCIAGVFGGLKSGVKESTTDIFLESAWFNPVFIRKTARRHQTQTDASFRFERGTDPDNTEYALKRAAMLIKEVAGGEISSDIIDVYPQPAKPFDVDFNINRCSSLIGKQISEETILKIFEGLEIKVVDRNGADFKLQVPPYRVDVTREADVIEDVLRIYGYNNVEIPEQVNSTLVYAVQPEPNKVAGIIAQMLTAQNFQEIMCNTLTKASYFEGYKCIDADKTVLLSNPLSQDLNALRQNLLFGALESAQHNRNHRNPDLKFFEFGNVHSLKKADADKGVQTSYNEEWHLSLLITGQRAEANWISQAQLSTFFDLKSVVNNIITRMGLSWSAIEEIDAESDIYSEGLRYMVDKSKCLVEFGMVNPKILKQFDIDKPVYFAEMNMNLLIAKSAKQNKIQFVELPKYPEVKRDLALLLDKDVTYAQVKTIAQKTERKLLKSVQLFDVYEGNKLPEGKKSYAVSFTLLDETKTLVDKQIDKIMEQLINAFKRELGAEIR